MNILFITQHYYPNKGGMAESCDRLIRNFKKQGITVQVFHFTNRKKKFKKETQVNGTYTALPIYPSQEFTLQLASQFILQADITKDITHIFAFGGHLPINFAPIISRFLQKPLATFIRGNDFDEAIFSKNNRSNLLYALENSEHIFSVTTEKAEKINRLLGQNKASFTPNGIDVKKWKLVPSLEQKVSELKSLSNGKKVLGIIGQLKAKKGILEFAETFSHFQFKDNYEVWLVGDIENDIREKLETFPVPFRYFSFMDKYSLIPYYYAVDAIVIPSFYDGMPNVLLEAGATKNFVIGASVGGIKDVIEYQKDGLLFNPFEPSELLECLNIFNQKTAEEVSVISEALYKKVSTIYTEQNEINNYLKILNQ